MNTVFLKVKYCILLCVFTPINRTLKLIDKSQFQIFKNEFVILEGEDPGALSVWGGCYGLIVPASAQTTDEEFWWGKGKYDSMNMVRRLLGRFFRGL